jgi:hypothetical protein
VAVVDVAPLQPAAQPELLAHARRLDWRFLLHREELGRVAYLGEEDRSLLDALQATAGELERPEADAQATYDVVVLRNPDRRLVERARSLVRPGGSVYVEIERPILRRLAGLRAPRRAQKALHGLGFGDVRLRWHWPCFERCVQIVPLDAPGVVGYALEQRAIRRSARARTWRDRALRRFGLLPAFAPSVSLVARAPGPGDGEPAIVRAVRRVVSRDELTRRRLADGPQALVFTPRFRTSRHVVGLLFPPGAVAPELVAKVPRLPGDNGGVANETIVLGEIGARTVPEGTIPRVVGYGPAGNRSVLVQSALAGKPLTGTRLRSEPARHITSVLAWLADVAKATGGVDSFAAWETLIAQPLQAFAAGLPRDSEEAALVARTLALTAPLADTALRLSAEHGDLSHPNLLVTAGGGVGVVDWEQGELHGLPLQDASYFLAFAVFSRAGARGVAEELAAFDEAFVRPGGWAARELAAYAWHTGVPQELVTPLFIACWARSALRMRYRLDDGPETAAGEWIRESRYYVLWRHALDHASQLQWEA